MKFETKIKERKPVSFTNIEDSILEEINSIKKFFQSEDPGISQNEKNKAEDRFHEIVNTLTKGRYLDRRNINHVLNALGDHYIYQRFEPKSRSTFSPDMRVNKSSFFLGFNYAVGINGYALSTRDLQPLIIFSPKNRLAHRYFRRVWSDVVNSSMDDSLNLFFNKYEQPILDPADEKYDYNIIELPEQPGRSQGPSWADVADCIVDFAAKKVYFYS